MIHMNVQMMEAGVSCFRREALWNALEVLSRDGEYGRSKEKRNLIQKIARKHGRCDLFLDWSAWHRLRCIALRLKKRNIGKSMREEIHRYAATFKESKPTLRSVKYRLGLPFCILGIIQKFPIPGPCQNYRHSPGIGTVACSFAPAKSPERDSSLAAS
jgi:hypothetical protein